MKNLFSLNAQQQKAVTHKQGPVLIVAGAGTGKTTVITERIKYLISKKRVNPKNIFAATFTDKAASEMLDRLDVAMPLGYEEPWLGTFHSLCDRILRREALEIGLDPGYRIITPVEQWMLVKRHLFDFELKYYRPLGNPTKFISALIKYFSRTQDEDTTPKDLLKFAKNKIKLAKSESDKEEAMKLWELSLAFEKYQSIKVDESLLDFNDLINQTLYLFRNRKSILKKYQDLFEYVLIDEFQDTNYAQFQLVKLMAPKEIKPNLMVVGDDDQSIYKFRGAAISNILQFKREYPEAKQIVLTINYRSIKPILEKSYHLIQNNNPYRLEIKLKINKKLKAVRQEKYPTPQIIKTNSEIAEADFTVSKIIELVAKRAYTYKDFAVLARANAHLDPFVLALKRAGIPYQLIGNRGLFEQSEVKELLNFLFVINNSDETPSLFHFLHKNFISLKAEVILDLVNKARVMSNSLWESMKKEESKKVKAVVTFVQEFQEQSLSDPVSKLLYAFIIKTNYLKEYTSQETIENMLKIKNINLLFDIVKRFETENPNSRLLDFIETLKLWQEAGESPAQAVIEDIDTVSLLTVHAAKGLEFPVVFIPCLIAGRFPAIDRRDPIEFPQELVKEKLPKDVQSVPEERRLFYVAMTRTKDELFLTYASSYGGLRQRKASGFLQELQIKEEIYEQGSDQLEVLLPSPPSPTVRYLDKKGAIAIKSLSYSQIDTFLACPLKYKYRYLLRIPAQPHHALSFGETIHSTLHEFHYHEQKGTILPLRKLLEIYKNKFINSGYESKIHKQKRFLAGKKALKIYHREFRRLFGKPTLLEKRFRLNIGEIQFVGKIDRIDETEAGLEIVDYKTGQSADQKSVDKDKQLSIYGLAAKAAFGLSINTMSLYFIEENLKITTKRSNEDYQREMEYLKKMIDKIKTSDFPAKPGYPFPCKFCEYNQICPFAKKN